MFSLKSKFRKILPEEKQGKPYILPTIYGIAFLFLIVDIFALGYYRDNAPYHTVGLTLIVFGLVAMIHTNANIQNISIIVESCEPSAAGDPSEMHLILKTEGGAPAHNLRLELEKTFQSQGVMIRELAQETQASLALSIPRRGVYPLRRVKLLSRGVYGLFQAWCWQSTDRVLVVYPKPRGSYPLPSGSDNLARKTEGEISELTRGGDDFQGHKPYNPGDSLQQVDWKAYARGQDMLLKDYSGEGSEALDLHWDDTRGPTEERLEQLSAWITAMNRAQRPYSLHLPHFTLPRGSGTKHDEAAYYALAAFEEA